MSSQGVEKVIIVGSGPAGWAAAIYAARASLNPLVFEGAVTEANRLMGTLPLGQLNLTTEVENYPGFPSGPLREYLAGALPEDRRPFWVLDNDKQPAHGVTGPELMELMRQQAVNCGARIITDDITGVDFSERPFRLTSLENGSVKAHAVIVATGAFPRKKNIKIMASRPVPSVMAPCPVFATNRSWWWAGGTAPSKRLAICPSLPVWCT